MYRWILLILLYMMNPVDGYMCHKCASTDAVWNWVKYGLPVNQGDSIVSDDKCLVESKLKKDGDACAGYCMTINITRTDEENYGRTISIVRDCQPRTKNLPDLNEDDAPLCISYEKIVNRRNVNITTCYCRGHYCNGLGFSEATRHSKAIELPQNSIEPKEASSFPWFLIHLALISFLF